MDFLIGDVHRAFSKERMERKQARAGNSMRHLHDIRGGVTDSLTDGWKDRPSFRNAMTRSKKSEDEKRIFDFKVFASQ